MKTAMQDTSLKAYRQKERFAPTQRRRIMNAVRRHGNMTNREIEQVTGIRISSVTARVFELRREVGVLELAETRRCEVSGKRAMAWRAKT